MVFTVCEINFKFNHAEKGGRIEHLSTKIDIKDKMVLTKFAVCRQFTDLRTYMGVHFKGKHIGDICNINSLLSQITRELL